MSNELATIDVDHEPAEPRALADLRTHALSVPVETMQRGLAEYFDRRTAFREWLRSKLVSGTHYGFPPACEPKPDPNNPGCFLVWMKGGYKSFPKEQWEPKPSLYQAGADFICDLMGARPEFAADLDAWKQLGEPKDTFVFACRLYSKQTKELLGEGRGVRAVGTKGGDGNNAIKMAQKSAKVAAVLNTWGLADLWTQDLEDGPPPPPHDNPAADESAPKAPPRNQRDESKAWASRISNIIATWKAQNPNANGDPVQWNVDCKQWVMKTTGRVFNPQKSAEWTADDAFKCERALNIEWEG